MGSRHTCRNFHFIQRGAPSPIWQIWSEHWGPAKKWQKITWGNWGDITLITGVCLTLLIAIVGSSRVPPCMARYLFPLKLTAKSFLEDRPFAFLPVLNGVLSAYRLYMVILITCTCWWFRNLAVDQGCSSWDLPENHWILHVNWSNRVMSARFFLCFCWATRKPGKRTTET